MAVVSVTDLTQDLILRILTAVGDPVSICNLETASALICRPSELEWGDVLSQFFPSLHSKLSAENFDGSFKQVFARRVRRGDEWRDRKERQQRSRTNSGCSESSDSVQYKAKPKQMKYHRQFFGDNRQGHLADSTLKIKMCTRCGEKYASSASRQQDACLYHTGELEPSGPEASALSRHDRHALAKSARLAIRNCGGASARRSGSKCHWSKGLGLPTKLSGKLICWTSEASCLEPDEVGVTWSCCQSIGLFAEGCHRGQHRHS